MDKKILSKKEIAKSGPVGFLIMLLVLAVAVIYVVCSDFLDSKSELIFLCGFAFIFLLVFVIAFCDYRSLILGHFAIYECKCCHKSCIERETYDPNDTHRKEIRYEYSVSFAKYGRVIVAKPTFDAVDVGDICYVVVGVYARSLVFNKKHWCLDDDLRMKVQQE